MSSFNLRNDFALVFFLIALATICGNVNARQNDDIQSERPSSNGIIFSIEKGGKRAFILGTIHAGYSNKQSLGRNILELLATVDDIYLEADISDKQRTGELVEKYGSDRDGPGLKAIIGDESYETYYQFAVVQRRIFTPFQFQSIRPWVLAMLLPMATREGDQVSYLKWGTESQLTDYAQAHNLPIFEIEGLQHQFEVYNSMDIEQQRAYFKSYVDEIQQHISYEMYDEDMNSWTRSSLVGLERTFDARKRRTDFYSVFHTSTVIEKRNLYFANKIAIEFNNPRSHLFAVGEQHLVGGKSLIKDLRGFGFKVKFCKMIQECLTKNQ